IQPGEVLTPSPLLAYSSSNVLLHFQLSPEGQLTSPQVPIGAERLPALMNGATTAGIETAAARLNEYQTLLNLERIALASNSVLNRDVIINGCAVFRTNTVGPITVPGQLLAQAAAPLSQQRNSPQWQEIRNGNEWQARANFNQAVQLQAVTNAYYGNQ